MEIHQILKHNIAGKLLNHLLVFLINVMIVRIMGPDLSGHYFNELYIVNFLVFIFSFGLDYSIVRLIGENVRHAHGCYRLITYYFIGFLLMAALWLIFQPVWAKSFFHQPAMALVFFASGSLMLIFYQAFLSALKLFNIQNYLLIATNAIFLIWLYWMEAEVDSISIDVVALAYAACMCVQGVLLALISYLKLNKDESKFQSWPYLKQGALIMISSIFYFLFLRVDNFFVEQYETAEVLGNYVQCGKVGQYFLYFSSIVSSTILPFMQSEGLASQWKSWLQLVRPYVLLILLVALFIAVGGYWVFPWLFGAKFEQMHSFMLIFLPGYVCLGMLTLLNAIYMSKGSIRRMFFGDVGGCILLILADSILVPRYGAIAAAWVSTISYCLAFLYLLAGVRDLYAKRTDTPLP